MVKFFIIRDVLAQIYKCHSYQFILEYMIYRFNCRNLFYPFRSKLFKLKKKLDFFISITFVRRLINVK